MGILDEDLGQDTLEQSVRVRALRREDLPRLVRIDEQSSGRRRQQWLAEKLERALEESNVRISLGAEHDGVLIGALLGSVQFGEFGLPEPIAVVDTVLVDPSFRRRGVGSAMLEQLLKNLQALHVQTVRTEVGWDELDLLGWFGGVGFKPAARLVLEMPVPSEQQNG